jgi:hypothetical protein
MLDRLVALHRDKATHEAMMARLRKEIDVLQQAVVDAFLAEGVQSVKTSDGVTISLHRRWWPKLREGATRDDVVAVLSKQWPDLVRPNYNGNSFNALVAECMKTDGALPEELARVVEATETIEARPRGLGAGEDSRGEADAA